MRISDDDRSFQITFQWTGDGSTVKGFPYMKAWPSRLPVQLWNISALEFSAQWRIYVQGTQHDSPEEQAVAYDNTALRANAAIDMFLSDDATNSTGLGSPIEIMIWPWYTPNVLPLGHAESTPDVDTVEVDGTKYSLYHGWNAQGQHVFSWLAHQNITDTNADYAPLLKYIWEKGLLSGALYVGQLEFGSEIMHAGQETVFEATNYTLKMIRDGDPDAPKPTTITPNATASPTSSSNTTATWAPFPTATEADSSANAIRAARKNGLLASIGLWFSILSAVGFMLIDF
jgi:hypothetical protein